MYEDIICSENFLKSWNEFLCGKRKRADVALFQTRLFENIFRLRTELVQKTYSHGGYHAFNISDPKPRNIHKATVRDRLLHHAIYRILYPYFDKKFIYDSYSCRKGKGTHKAIERFKVFARKVSKNNTKTCWVLKCDIRKFFASIEHEILFKILERHVEDVPLRNLLKNIIQSFQTAPSKGLPLGNLTSQLLVNIYMNEFDQHVKHTLKAKYYIRYADDFVFMSTDKKYLEKILLEIEIFLNNELKLTLHPDKVFIKTLASGMDFLGWVNFPNHRVLRTATKKRMMRNIKENQKEEVVQAYLGMLSHGNGYKLKKQVFLIE